MKRILLILFIINCTLQIANAQWQQLPNLPITGTVYDMYFVNANTGWITLTNGFYTLKTTDGGLTWVTQLSGTTLKAGHLQFFNDTVGVALGSDASNTTKIIKTTNGGANWNVTYTTSNVFQNISFVNKDTGWVCGTDGFLGGIWQTSDAGLSFQRQFTSSTGTLSKIFFLKQKGPSGYIGWAVEMPKVYKTTNSGTSWVLVYSGVATFCNGSPTSDMYFKDSLNGVITRGGDCFNITTNGGYNWALINQFNATGGKIAVSNSTAWITLAEDSVIKTTNFFLTFGKQPIPVTAVKPVFAVDTNIVYGGLNNTIMIKTTNGGGNIVSVSTISSEVPNKFYLYQNFPNPFNPTATIRFDLPQNVKVNIKIYDLLGREVKQLVDEFKQAGSYSVNFDGTNLASGVYFYRIEAGQFVESKKMVLVK